MNYHQMIELISKNHLTKSNLKSRKIFMKVFTKIFARSTTAMVAKLALIFLFLNISS
jgi:hypothetical protein